MLSPAQELKLKYDEFVTTLSNATFVPQSEDQHGGTRYFIQIPSDAGIRRKLYIPSAILSFVKINMEFKTIFVYPKNDKFTDVKFMKQGLEKLMEAVQKHVPAKEYTKLIKSDKKDGIALKLIIVHDNILSRFFDNSGVAMEHDDERLSERYDKSMYPYVVADSVYVSAAGVASIQLKIVEAVCYTKKVQSILDVSFINRIRAMQLNEQ